MAGSIHATDQQQIVALVQQEVRALSEGDPESFFAILADDAAVMPPGTALMRGTELRGWMRDFVERFSVEWLEWVSLETEVAGDLAFHTYAYSWRVTRKAGGPGTLAHGKGIHVFRRDAHGEWKLAREMWNASPAPPTGSRQT